MSWRIREHTADLVIEADGDDAGGCLDAAGLALTSVMTGHDAPHELAADEEAVFHVDAPDLDALAVAFLSELLWLGESKDLLWTGGGVELTVTDDGLHRASAKGNMAAFDPHRHGRGVEVKAITYHDLHFGAEKDEWSLRVLLDI